MPEALGAVQKVAVAAPDDWVRVIDSLRTKLSTETFDTWFSLIEFHGIDHAGKLLRLRAPNEIVRKWVTTSFSSLLDQTLIELSLPGYSIGWLTEDKAIASTAMPSNEIVESQPPGIPSNGVTDPRFFRFGTS